MSRNRRKRAHTQPRYRRAVAEGACAPERARVAEAGTATAVDGPGRFLMRLIKAGWSLNGRYYPAEVLRRDGAAAFGAGTQSFIDHQTPEEVQERPVGSVKDLAAVLLEDARWDETEQALVAQARVFAPWRQGLTEMAADKAIGVSIRAWVTGSNGEADGREGFIVDSLEAGQSVDFVTKPAAGGAILAILESLEQAAVTEARTIGAWLESRLHLALTQHGDDMYGDGRLTRDERITLSSAIGDALQAWTARVEADAPQLFQRSPWDDPPEQAAAEAPTDDTRAVLTRAIWDAFGDENAEYGTWLIDFDPEAATVWYHDAGKIWQQSYTATGGAVVLADDRVEVLRRTVYVPAAPAPAGEQAPAPAATPVVEHLDVEQVAAELSRADQVLSHSPAGVPGPASTDGPPPTAPQPSSEGDSTMSGPTTQDAPVSGQAGTVTGTPTSEALTIVTEQRDDLRTKLAAATEALADAQAAARTAAARADAAEAEAARLRGNDAGRLTVDRMLADPASAVPESMYAAIAPRVHDRVRDKVPLAESGEVDQAALEALVASAIKTERTYIGAVLESQGMGRPAGLGGDGAPGLTAEAFDAQLTEQFTSIGLDPQAAKLAAKGRA